MIIEIFGLPGVGKSSFVRAWIESDKKYKNIKINNKLQLLFFNLFYFLHYPYKFIISLFFIFKYGGSGRLYYSKFMNIFLQYNARFIKAKLNKLSILDQGHIMSVLSLFEDEVDFSIMKKIYDNINKPDILIILEASNNIRHSRLESRGYGIRENISKEYGKKFLSIMENNYQQYKLLIDNDNRLKKVFFNTDLLDSQQLVQKVKQILDL